MAEFRKDKFYFANKQSRNPVKEDFRRHLHNEYELYYFLEGNSDYLVGDSVYRLRKNDLLLIRPSVYHFAKLNSDAPYHRIVINFPKEELPDPLLSALDEMQTYYNVPAESAIARAYKNAVCTIEQYSSEEDRYIALQGILHFILLALKYEAQPQSGGATVVHPLLGEILRYVDENLEKPLDISSLAKTFFVSESWITHAFRNHLQISAMQYINRKRILYAQQLIAGGTPPTEAAAKCAFENYSTFYRQYKKYLNTPPKGGKN